MIFILQLVFKICVFVVYMCICVYICLCMCSCLFVWAHTCECACLHMPVNAFLYYPTPRLWGKVSQWPWSSPILRLADHQVQQSPLPAIWTSPAVPVQACATASDILYGHYRYELRSSRSMTAILRTEPWAQLYFPILGNWNELASIT